MTLSPVIFPWNLRNCILQDFVTSLNFLLRLFPCQGNKSKGAQHKVLSEGKKGITVNNHDRKIWINSHQGILNYKELKGYLVVIFLPLGAVGFSLENTNLWANFNAYAIFRTQCFLIFEQRAAQGESKLLWSCLFCLSADGCVLLPKPNKLSRIFEKTNI